VEYGAQTHYLHHCLGDADSFTLYPTGVGTGILAHALCKMQVLFEQKKIKL
jgi:hypothetical protein